jgi:hypothetical protein
LVTRPSFKRKRTSKITVEERKLPNINPSVREIWKLDKGGNVFYKTFVIGNFLEEDDIDKSFNLDASLHTLIQELSFTHEDILEFFRFLPSLLALCKSRNVRVTDIPKIPSLEEYKKIEEGED